jgi:hypothetical protein
MRNASKAEAEHTKPQAATQDDGLEEEEAKAPRATTRPRSPARTPRLGAWRA